MARFAETNGFEGDGERPQAWRYRDWVVRALNDDLPYDQFIRDQVAGDEIAPGDFESRVATGFLRAGPAHVVGGNMDPRVTRQEWLTEAVAGVGNAVLGLTVQCARCHDHKFDPIPQADYYRLQAFFAATANLDYPAPGSGEKERYEAALRAHQERLKPVREQIAAIEQPYRERLRQQKLEKLDPEYRAVLALDEKRRTPEQQRLAQDGQRMLSIAWDELVAVLTPVDRERRAALRQQMHALDREAPSPPAAAPGVAETLNPVPAVHVLLRGELSTPGPEVRPAFPLALQSPGAEAAAASAARRTALARWLTDSGNPLTARVIVNRVWQHHFGRGLVATPNDFGRNGARPTHPSLLDWLASTFSASGGVSRSVPGSFGSPLARREHTAVTDLRARTLEPGNRALALGWSLKRLHYLLVTSAAYRQASDGAESFPNRRKSVKSVDNPGFPRIRNPRSVDPENRLLWRMNRQRLDAEALRDAILRVAGTLNEERGGPPVRVPLEPEVYATIFTEGEPDNLWPVTPDPGQHVRRSLYLLHKRNVRLPMLAVFDAPDMMTSCAARGQSVHALQALTLMNSDFMLQQSRALAQRLLSEREPVGSGQPAVGSRQEPVGSRQSAVGSRYGARRRDGAASPRQSSGPPAGSGRIERLYLLALGRPPRAEETASAERFLREQTATVRERLARGEPVTRLDGIPPEVEPAAAAAWVDLCLAVFNLNEFVYVR